MKLHCTTVVAVNHPAQISDNRFIRLCILFEPCKDLKSDIVIAWKKINNIKWE
jgi:hypothetical protein